MISLETRAEIAQMRANEHLAQAAHDRRVAGMHPARLPWSRRVARPLGHMLLHMSVMLLRYAHVDAPAVLYRVPAQSVELN